MTAEFNPFSLRGKRVLVTGATSGLGHCVALTCARMGAEVIGVGRDEERLARTAEALAGISDAAHVTIKADLTDEVARATVISSLRSPVDGVVHGAGISRLSPVRLMTVDHLREVQTINVEAPVMLTQGLLRHGLVAPGGSIVFVASIAAHIGVAGVGAYSGTKAALIGLMRCLAVEVVKRRIRANCLSPSLVQSPMLEAASKVSGDLEQLRKDHPLGFGKPEDVANAAVFLLSDASSWITGTTIVMDGGLTIS
ncbi:MAG: SDR family NAD(P)-dependent oxidoreductase [Burkholderiaceae bacterium]